MDELKPRKNLAEDADATAAESAAVSRGIASDAPKARPKTRQAAPSGRVKPPVPEARKQAADAEREPGRQDLPLPPAADPGERGPEGHSLGMRLQVSGDRITVLDSLAIDTPALAPEPVRGTDFLAVLAGPEVLAIKRLIDPGLAFGIPDPEDPEYRGHREMRLDPYELTILVPLEKIDRMSDRDEDPDRTDRPAAAVEIVLYRARETTVIEPRELTALRDRDDVEAVASSGRLTADDLRATLWTGGRGRGTKRPSDAESSD